MSRHSSERPAEKNDTEGTPVVVPHIDFDEPTGNPQAEVRKGYGLTPLETGRIEREAVPMPSLDPFRDRQRPDVAGRFLREPVYPAPAKADPRSAARKLVDEWRETSERLREQAQIYDLLAKDLEDRLDGELGF